MISCKRIVLACLAVSAALATWSGTVAAQPPPGPPGPPPLRLVLPPAAHEHPPARRLRFSAPTASPSARRHHRAVGQRPHPQRPAHSATARRVPPPPLGVLPRLCARTEPRRGRLDPCQGCTGQRPTRPHRRAPNTPAQFTHQGPPLTAQAPRLHYPIRSAFFLVLTIALFIQHSIK